MSPANSSTAAVVADHHSENRQPIRPQAGAAADQSGQEALFFGITFAVAVVFQLAVILKVANVIAW